MRSHDKIAVRLAQIIVKLNSGERLSIDELVEEFSVNKRTILRDFERLSILPIQKENGKYFLEEYALGKLSFKDIKAFASLIGARSLFPELDDRLISDVLNEKLNKAYLIKNQGFESIQISRDDFEAVSAAVIKNRIVDCEYNDKERKLKPYKLINNSGIWYLLADDEGKLKNFTPSKIKRIKIKGDTFSANAEFLKRIEKNDTNWFSDAKFKVTLEIKNEAMEYFKRKEFLPNYEVVQEEEDKIIISTEVAYDDEILRVVKYWLPFIKIVEPLNLKKKFENLLRGYLK
ncbi:transcriptional regulator (WYL domain) [Campylobacter showae]|mgnify:FL=1|uniref:HTH domain protein n=1 Tax=Campylobacter showae RM3277 TaxID=553219 RepID=C6RGT8_9BACT|nr:WYL domain-containing protein [Campylobacter showae]EET79423.1 HTH domain protein [Campylobacter showae RM3277]QCD49553.1 transcriptional regulator (WYL domain) [Campylobacter showae]